MALDIWLYSILSVVIVSLISFVGVLSIPLKITKRKNFILFLISFSIGALLGDAFLHILPEAVAENGFTIEISLFTLSGILIFFIIEKTVHWKHKHDYGMYKEKATRRKSAAIMNLVGDGIHNFTDGIVIGVTYLVSIPLGIATTIAVIFHEIPQEFGDFGVLIYGGFSKGKALFFNFLSALTALIGVVIVLIIGPIIGNYSSILVPFAAGGFIYLACSNLMPELQKDIELKNSIIQIFGILLGITVMIVLLTIG
ncbi:MAG: ZIP family metal transporter [Candidatus Aenigmarchaeota archaeon]|nr:ZIP family metal transporter [Candidatus Aenigmarchaeota archaeon]